MLLYAHRSRTDTKQYMKPVDADVEMLKEMFREKIGRDWLEATRDNDESLMGFKGSKPWEEIQIAAVKETGQDGLYQWVEETVRRLTKWQIWSA